MKICYASDLHLEHDSNFTINDTGDVFILAGDILPIVHVNKPKYAHFFEDLAAVANAGRGLDGGGGGRVALDLLVVAGRATQREGLPLVIGRGRLLFADVRRERGLVGGDLVNLVFEVFAIANGRVGLLGIRGDGH